MHRVVGFRCFLLDFISRNLRTCEDGDRESRYLPSPRKSKAPPRCAPAAALCTLRFRIGAAWSWTGETLNADLTPSSGASREPESLKIQGRVPKCPSQVPGDSSLSCGVLASALEIHGGLCRLLSLQTGLWILVTVAELEAAGALSSPSRVSQVAIGQRTGVHCDLPAPSSSSSSREFLESAKLGNMR